MPLKPVFPFLMECYLQWSILAWHWDRLNFLDIYLTDMVVADFLFNCETWEFSFKYSKNGYDEYVKETTTPLGWKPCFPLFEGYHAGLVTWPWEWLEYKNQFTHYKSSNDRCSVGIWNLRFSLQSCFLLFDGNCTFFFFLSQTWDCLEIFNKTFKLWCNLGFLFLILFFALMLLMDIMLSTPRPEM